ncbi:MAG: MarC family protein [Nitrospira sp.]|nr:MarC family protein [Gammaproteobacteria bacterium]MBP6607379.1 MarC family protein [Nitrospira sp.]MBK7521713.1 MarC family protein [Gammaproteobacteria bacterium]MBK7729481.1 MarC family protein [Gammaproteobacteria bacterium]MBK8307490.1 MarC family protein [Gammaproteobacteria bacterium]
MRDFVSTFVFFFTVIDPIGTIPVFIALTQNFSEIERRRIAIRSTIIAAVVLVFFVLAVELLLSVMSIPLAAFQIAGGVVLFLFALSMIFGESKPEEELRVDSAADAAVFPLAIPSIASPGAMLAAVMLTDKDRFDLWEQLFTTSILLLVLGITLVLMLWATRIHRLIGNSGASVLSRIMGLILSSAAVASMLAGIDAYFSLR